MAGVIRRFRQRHQRSPVVDEPSSDSVGVAAQYRFLTLDAAFQQFGIKRIEVSRHRQGNHEVAAAIANQPFHLAFVVALGGAAEFVFEQIVALQLGKGMSPFALAVSQYIGNGNLGVVVQDGLRYAAQKGERGDMAVQKRFGVFCRVSFDEAGIRMWHVQTEVMEPDLLAADVPIGFAEINLGMAWPVRQRHEHFLLPGGHAIDVFAHDGVAAAVAILVTQSLAYAYRRVALFYMHVLVGFENRINDGNEWGEFGGRG